MKYFIAIIILLSQFQITNATPKTINIGIILPIEHKAMKDISEGFTSSLNKKYPDIKFDYTIKNAQGDPNILRSIAKSFASNNHEVVVTIGTQAAQIAMQSSNKDKIIIALAAKTENLNLSKNLKYIVIEDEIGPEYQLKFISNLEKSLDLSIIYSNNEKSISEVEEAEKLSKKYKLEIKKISVNTIQDIYSIKNYINTDNIIIFKDHIVASAISAIIKQTGNKLVLTSDEGTVKSAACAGIGVTESDIGKLGAENLDIYSDKMQIVKKISNINLFINKNHCTAIGNDISKLESAAKKSKFKIKYIN